MGMCTIFELSGEDPKPQVPQRPGQPTEVDQSYFRACGDATRTRNRNLCPRPSPCKTTPVGRRTRGGQFKLRPSKVPEMCVSRHFAHILLKTSVGVQTSTPTGPTATAPAYMAYYEKPKSEFRAKASRTSTAMVDLLGTGMVVTGCRSAVGGKSFHRALQRTVDGPNWS